MPHLLRVSLKAPPSGDAYPFSVPAIRALPTLDLNVGVTFFVGENGSGKSTLLEGIATAAEVATLGASEAATDITLAPARTLASSLRLAWSVRSRQGFFLRAEDFFGFQRAQARTDARIRRENRERDIPPEDRAALATGSEHTDEEMAARFIARYDHRSHGESFLDAFRTRVRPRGLYLLDEPETPLSPKHQIELARLILDATRKQAQFVIATHSPILLATPGAKIYAFDGPEIAHVEYESLEHVRLTREFLAHPERFFEG